MTIFSRFPFFALALICGLSSYGCSGMGKPVKNPTGTHKSLFSWLGHFPIPKIAKKPKPPTATPVQWSGTIRMVNTQEHFVLIEQTTHLVENPSEIYVAIENGQEKGMLKMTSMKSFPYLIADIVEGNPEVGDKIYLPSPSFPTGHTKRD